MSTALHALLVVGAAVVVALAIQALVRRKVPLEVLKAHHEVGGVLMAAVGGLYGILLGFSVVVVWEQFDRSREEVAREANALADVYRLARGIPGAEGEAIRTDVVAYFELVVRDEWPKMAERSSSEELDRTIGELWSGLTAFRPTDDRERNLQLVALNRMADLSDQRRLRLLAGEHELPRMLWVVLIVGAVVTVGFSYFFGLRYLRSQAVMLALFAGLIALALFTLAALDRPFDGDERVGPGDFEIVRRQLGIQ